MAGVENKILFGNGVKIQPSQATDISNMQELTTDIGLINHTGNPTGVVSANPGSLVFDPVSGNIYQKASGTGSSGWQPVGSGSLPVPYIDQGVSTTVASNKGYFATAAITLTLPAAPAQGDTIDIICDTAGAVVIQAAAGQIIQIGSSSSSVAGTQTSTATGCTVELVYRAADTKWISQGNNGTWTPA